MPFQNPSVAWSSKKCPNVTVTGNVYENPTDLRPITQQISPDEFTLLSLWLYYYLCLLSMSDLALLAGEYVWEDFFFFFKVCILERRKIIKLALSNLLPQKPETLG